MAATTNETKTANWEAMILAGVEGLVNGLSAEIAYVHGVGLRPEEGSSGLPLERQVGTEAVRKPLLLTKPLTSHHTSHTVLPLWMRSPTPDPASRDLTILCQVTE